MIDQNTLALLQQIEDKQEKNFQEMKSIGYDLKVLRYEVHNPIRDELTDLHDHISSTRRLTFITVLICVLTVGYVGHIATKAIANAAATVAQIEGMNHE